MIKTFFDEQTATFTYIVADSQTKKAAVIDSVLNFEYESGQFSTTSADHVLTYLNKNDFELEWILETHIHADHITAAHYLKEKTNAKIGIGSKITDVIAYWAPVFDMQSDVSPHDHAFDVLFSDQDTFKIGTLLVEVLHTPGHTPACVCYKIDNAVFVGDTIFAPNIGTARTDFPGGSAYDLYESCQRILKMPDDMIMYVGHDYPTSDRPLQSAFTILEQKKENILLKEGIAIDDYVTMRHQRDHGKKVPRLLLPAIQMNIRCGALPAPHQNGKTYLNIPVTIPKNV
ncbi:MAG: Beta-lactamase hydrolase-like protein [Holosporales bacterium]